jgi:hypothetical protein
MAPPSLFLGRKNRESQAVHRHGRYARLSARSATFFRLERRIESDLQFGQALPFIFLTHPTLAGYQILRDFRLRIEKPGTGTARAKAPNYWGNGGESE